METVKIELTICACNIYSYNIKQGIISTLASELA